MKTREQIEAEAQETAMVKYDEMAGTCFGITRMTCAIAAYEAALWQPIAQLSDDEMKQLDDAGTPLWVFDTKLGIKEATLSFGGWRYDEWGQAFGIACLENATHFRYPPVPPRAP